MQLSTASTCEYYLALQATSAADSAANVVGEGILKLCDALGGPNARKTNSKSIVNIFLSNAIWLIYTWNSAGSPLRKSITKKKIVNLCGQKLRKSNNPTSENP